MTTFKLVRSLVRTMGKTQWTTTGEDKGILRTQMPGLNQPILCPIEFAATVAFGPRKVENDDWYWNYHDAANALQINASQRDLIIGAADNWETEPHSKLRQILMKAANL
jgi:hypothetical protein